eukprot:1159509-Pelagomonas_calceolata.AAC.10
MAVAAIRNCSPAPALTPVLNTREAFTALPAPSAFATNVFTPAARPRGSLQAHRAITAHGGAARQARFGLQGLFTLQAVMRLHGRPV